ncbi:hypothetical protein C9374_007505 [Naegleria lovaniensis]|uniref:L-2-amino-thiazoline-4-carboxylic acid hydrolase n=1 Tax=Naegleria lovaniensis TaxID=51637 RepID=A0AA88GLK0_NAELO|nr:uncharacterized protein C9374_007505 [Naegleria lovaniensis]KAG2379366.1 hypothetical protein C9374_007505 [Naegleria lovaniensis]
MLKSLLRSYLAFSNKYYVPIMYRYALKRALKLYRGDVHEQIVNNNLTKEAPNNSKSFDQLDWNKNSQVVNELMNTIKQEQDVIMNSEITRQFLQNEKEERNMIDKSWLPLVAQYIASNRVLARELFNGDETKAMLFIYDRALLPPVEKMMRMVLGGQGRKGIASGWIVRTPRAGEDDNQVDVLEYMWKMMSMANDLIHAWTLTHEIYHETKLAANMSLEQQQQQDKTLSGQDDDSSKKIRISTIRVHHCMLNRFFRAHNALNLMPVICSFDTIWARNAYEHTGHKLRRNQTLSLGGNYCAFDFSKDFDKEHDVVSIEIEKLRKQ